jgi:1,4-alpha-glucan branching enzyme
VGGDLTGPLATRSVTMAEGYLAVVLHAHLPFVRHPEHRYHLEEQWLYEAIAATYLPLLEVYRNLVRDGVHFRVTMSMTPPLVSMLRDDLLKTRAAAYLDRLVELGDRELHRTQQDPAIHRLARWYRDRFGRLKALYDELRGDIVGAYAQLQNDGFLELITCTATHGFLPVVADPTARRVQVQLAADHYREHFGVSPRGIWLAECGYVEGVDQLLADAGLRYFFVDHHGLANAHPRPPFVNFAPVYTRAGVAAFGRDVESSKQVWSSQEGYPGDGTYREFYRDIGFDLPLDYIGPFVHPDGIRVNTGYKYHRITGRVGLGDKELYDPDAARERAAVHAGNFLFNREKQVEHLARKMDRKPLVVSPYDAELYGHWWFEGPMWLDLLCRKAHYDQDHVKLVTPSEYLREYPVNAVVEPSPSSWGDGGYASFWIDGTNDWIYPHVHRAEARMAELATRFANLGDSEGDQLRRRALNQMARELLLVQSSDWAFILRTGTTVGYAAARVKAHLARFRKLDRMVTEGGLEYGEPWVADVEQRDNIFPRVDFRAYRAA